MTTVKENLGWARDHLRARGIDHPDLEAGVLLADLLHIERLRLWTDTERPLSSDEQAAFAQLVERRGNREPLAHLRGHREFMSLDFIVSPDTLVPRPETEILVEAILDRVSRDPLIGADIGTGSGAIVVSLAHALPAARIYATDISASALEVAARNCARHQVADRVTLLEGDLLAPLEGRGLEGRLDFIAANLPYVRRAELATLSPEVRAEPRVALDGGEDGLDLYRRLIPAAAAYLTARGLLAVEIDPRQAAAVVRIAGGVFPHAETLTDYAGHERVVIFSPEKPDVADTAAGR
jgi:release factor glutamine methyltransferase